MRSGCSDTCCRRRRSRSRPGTYMALENQLVDAPSRQLLFNEFELCTMGRTRLKRRQGFSEVTANALINKHMRKKKSTGYVNFLVDRMRFGRSCCNRCCRREYLNYREIKQLYTFPSRPNAFMLAVEEENTGKRYYETYMCKNAGDMARVQQLIEQTAADPQNLLRTNTMNTMSQPYPQPPPPVESILVPTPAQNNVVYTAPRPMSRTTSPIEPTMVTRSVRINEYTPAVSTYNQTPIIIEQQQTTEEFISPPSPPIVRQYRQPQTQFQSQPATPERVIPVRSYSPVFDMPQPTLRNKPMPTSYSTEQISDLGRNSRILSVPMTPRSRSRSLYFERNEINSWRPDEVTFLEPNTNNGVEVVDRGSIYLFVSRSKHDDLAAPESNQYFSGMQPNDVYWS